MEKGVHGGCWFNPPLGHGGRNLHPSATDPTATGGNCFSATMGGFPFPFTCAQRKELERQAMIYKYIMASVPVPASLLFPPSSNPSASVSMNGGDLERCKRTDGKKWRCSRDVVPNHRYCERHLQKSRPRSRKPVEVKNNGINKSPKIDLSIKKKSERSMELTRAAGQKWQNLVDASVGFGDEGSIYSSIASVFHRDYVEQQQQPLDMFSYSDEVLKFPHYEKSSRGFIDAWSNENESGNFESSVSSEHRNPSTCSLDLSMSMSMPMAMAANAVDDEEKRKNLVDDSQLLTLSPVSWMSQGGPLAEALRPVSTGGVSNPASPYDSINSTPTTTVSSPSGVLNWTLISNSDGSVCNSPTTLAAAVTASQDGFAFQYLR